MNAEQFAYAHQHTLNKSIEHLFGDAQSVEAVHAYRQQMDYGEFLKYLKIEPHLTALLRKIRKTIPTINTAIATNRTDTVNRLLVEFKLTEYFDLVVTSVDIPRPKPHPDMLLKILSHFGIASDQALYVGDSQVDAEAAVAAKVTFVAYRNTALQAPYHIESLKELESLLEV
jgi:HAD superfamily hydrolase (TIGR01549 family)